jgi:hypothetical protein
MNDVIQQQYQDIQRQGDIQKQGANAQAVGSGAFGGSRQGIQQAEINRNVLDQQARTGSQLRSGALGQQQAQKSLDITRANDLARQNLPYQQIGFMSDIFRGVPALQQTTATTTAPGASTTSQMLGLAQAGIGAYGMMNQGKYGRS